MKVAIYGAGITGNRFYKAISKEIKIDFFIDKYKSGNFNDIPIIGVDKIPKDTIIYNSVMGFDQEIYKELKEIYKDLKSKNIIFVFFSESLKKFHDIINEFYKEKYLWFNGNRLNDRLKEVRKLLHDKVSLNFFDNWVKFRETFDMKYYLYPTNSLEEQYFIDEFKHSERFVDCGGFTGDTISAYYRYNKGRIISFEPDPTNLKKLNKSAKNKDVLVYPMGVFDETKILKFKSCGSGGNLCEEGDILVPVTSLDETIYNFRPDYIKMDIEGAEIEAIKGAKNIIKDFSPNLAISIYHKASDLWEIPLLIKEINPKYEFKIRSHNHLCLETILYCKVES